MFEQLQNGQELVTNAWLKKVEQLYKLSSPCLDDHQVKQEERESVGVLSEVCSQIVLRCKNLARIGRPDILWSVNKFARSVTVWTQACDRRLARLISYIHHTNDFRLVMWETRHSTVHWVHSKTPTLQEILKELKINLRRRLVYLWE